MINEFASNARWTVLGDGVYAACQWGILIVIARLGDAEMVGRFALGLAITAPIMLFCSLALRPVLSTDAKSEYKFGEYLALRLLSIGAALIAIAAVSTMTGADTVLIMLALGLAKAVEAVSDVCYGFLQKNEQMAPIAKSNLLKGPLSLIAVAAVLYLTHSLAAAVFAMVAIWGLILVLFDMPNCAVLNSNRLGLIWASDRLCALFRLALPLGVAVMLLALNANMPRYFIQHYLGVRELGIFAAMAYLMVAGSAFVNSIGQTISPRLARYWADDDLSHFRSLLLRLAGSVSLLGASGIVAAWLAGPPVLRLLYGGEFADRSDVLVWIMVAAAVSYIASALGYGMMAARLIRIQSVQFTFVTAAGVLGCFVLVPSYGLVGAACAMIVSHLVQLLIATLSMWCTYRRRLRTLPLRTISSEMPTACGAP